MLGRPRVQLEELSQCERVLASRRSGHPEDRAYRANNARVSVGELFMRLMESRPHPSAIFERAPDGEIFIKWTNILNDGPILLPEIGLAAASA